MIIIMVTNDNNANNNNNDYNINNNNKWGIKRGHILSPASPLRTFFAILEV